MLVLSLHLCIDFIRVTSIEIPTLQFRVQQLMTGMLRLLLSCFVDLIYCEFDVFEHLMSFTTFQVQYQYTCF